MLYGKDLILLSSSLPPHQLKPQERGEWNEGLSNSLQSYRERLYSQSRRKIDLVKLNSLAWISSLKKWVFCSSEILTRKKVKREETDWCCCDCGYTNPSIHITVYNFANIFTFICLYLRLPVTLEVITIYLLLNQISDMRFYEILWFSWDHISRKWKRRHSPHASAKKFRIQFQRQG